MVLSTGVPCAWARARASAALGLGLMALELVACSGEERAGGSATGGGGSSGQPGDSGGGGSVAGSGGAGATGGGASGAAGAGGLSPGPPPSCAESGPGLTDCGPNSDESCCTSLPVPGGTFYRSYDAVTHTSRDAPATVSSFRLDKYEVTIARFRRFKAVWDAGWRPAKGSGRHLHLHGGKGVTVPGGGRYEVGWDPVWEAEAKLADEELLCNWTGPLWTPEPGANEQRPLDCVDWHAALAFCIWDGGFLPSEAEWNYAAAGGSEQRVYPWSVPPTSTEIDCSRAAYQCRWINCEDAGTPCAGPEGVLPGSRPAGDGRWGHAEVAGNVGEWTLDYRERDYRSESCIDCANLTVADAGRISRGGARDSSSRHLKVSERSSLPPIVGIRCARSP